MDYCFIFRLKNKLKVCLLQMTNDNLFYPFIGNVNCGGHTAQSCAYCPQGNGHYWCNGDCQWNWGTNACETTSSQRKDHRHSLSISKNIIIKS